MLDSMIDIVWFAHLDSEKPAKTIPPTYLVAWECIGSLVFPPIRSSAHRIRALFSDVLDWASQKDYRDKQACLPEKTADRLPIAAVPCDALKPPNRLIDSPCPHSGSQ